MKRNAITGEYTFNIEEVCVIALGISARCEYTLKWYRTTIESCNSGTAGYFANEFNAANKLYKELFGADYPATTDEGPVPTPDTTPDSADC